MYAALSLGAIAAPLLLVKLNLPFVWNVFPVYEEVKKFQLLGSTGALALAIIAWIELRRRAGTPWRERLTAILPLFLALQFLVLVAEYSRKPGDYQAYEYAGRALLQGEDPYREALPAPYPPLIAKTMAAAYRSLQLGAASLHVATDPRTIWSDIFYFFQCGQLLLIVSAYFLCNRFARELGMNRTWASVLVAALLLVSFPLFGTLRYGGVDFWVLNLALLGILLASRAPFAAGAAIALGGHIKLYPLTLLLSLIVIKRWRATAWAFAVLSGIVFLQCDLGRDWTVWQQYLDYMVRTGGVGGPTMENNSLRSIFFNSYRLLTGGLPFRHMPEVRFLTALSILAVATWFLLRLVARERAYRAQVTASTGGGGRMWVERRRFFGHAVDSLAFGLVCSPSVWVSHHMLTLPLVIWAIATRGHDRPRLVAAGTFLMLAMPTFSIFPLSYHHLVGMIMLLVVASPRTAWNPSKGGDGKP